MSVGYVSVRHTLQLPDGLWVPRENILLSTSVLGEGAFSYVVQATWRREGEAPCGVAVKVMSKAGVRPSLEDLYRELEIACAIDHTSVVSVIGVAEDEENVLVLMEQARGGELARYLKSVGLEDMPLVATNFIAETLTGLEYLAEHGIVHRDIKPENLLLTGDYHIKIADFGSACRMDTDLPFSGTLYYAAPEVISGGCATPSSDLWSLGCIIYQLFVGVPPFQGGTEYQLIQEVTQGHVTYPPYFPREARDLCDSLLRVEPKDRPSPYQLKSHPFFCCIDWTCVTVFNNVTHLNYNHTKAWASYLTDNESVIYTSLVDRLQWLYSSRRHLVLTDTPRLFCVDVETSSVQERIHWGKELCVEAHCIHHFSVYSADMVYKFIDLFNRADLWAAKINHLVKRRENRSN